jgi:O-antigen/teichoic acid export membrane protein
MRDTLAHILGLRIVITSLGVLLGVVFGVVAGYQQELIVGIGVAGIGVLLQSIQAAMLMPLSVELKNGLLALNQVLTQAVLLVGFVVLAAAGAGLVPFFAVQIAVGVVLLAAAPAMLARRHLVAPRWTPARMRELGRIAVPVAVGTVLGVLYLRILVIIMSLVSGKPDQIGYFVTSTRVMELIGGVPFLVVSIMLPVATVAARDDPARLVYMSSRVAQMMVIGGVLTALLAWTLARPIVTVLGGSQYGPAGPVLQIQGFATITVFLTSAWLPAIIGLGLLRAYWLAMIAGLVAVVIAGLILIGPFQATGAAVAAVIADVTLSLAMYVVVRRSGLRGWLRGGAMLRIGGATALAVGVGVIGGVPSVVRAVLVTGVFVFASLLLGAVPSELTDTLRTWVARLRRATGRRG